MEGLKMAQGESAVGMEVRVQTASSVLSDANKLNNSLSHPHWWGVQGVSQLQHTAIGVFLVGFTVTATVSNILVVSTCLGWVQDPEIYIYTQMLWFPCVLTYVALLSISFFTSTPLPPVLWLGEMSIHLPDSFHVTFVIGKSACT